MTEYTIEELIDVLNKFPKEYIKQWNMQRHYLFLREIGRKKL